MANQLMRRFGSDLVGRAALLPALKSKAFPQSLQSLQSRLSSSSSSTQTSEVDNGLRVVTQELTGGGATASVGVFVETGSRYESEQNSGATSLVVRALLRQSGSELAEEVQRMGAQLSACVQRDRTAVTVRCLSRDANKAVQMLSKLIAGSGHLSAEAVESARRSLLQDMHAMDSHYESVVMNGLHAMAYQNTSLSLPVIGRSESVRALKATDLIDFWHSQCRGPRVVLAVAADLQHQNVVDWVESSALKQIPIAYDKSDIPELLPCRYTGSDIRIRDDSMPVAHIALAVEGAGRDSPDHWALLLAAQLLGQWDRTFGGGQDCSSYLGLCSAADQLTHSFRAFSLSYAESGLFGAYMVTERMKQEDLIWHLTYEWKRFCTQLTDNELERAKNALITQHMRRRDAPNSACVDIAEQTLGYGKALSLDEVEARLRSITASTVRRVCTEYIWDRCPTVSAIGPIEQLEDYEVLRGKTYWVRY